MTISLPLPAFLFYQGLCRLEGTETLVQPVCPCSVGVLQGAHSFGTVLVPSIESPESRIGCLDDWRMQQLGYIAARMKKFESETFIRDVELCRMKRHAT